MTIYTAELEALDRKRGHVHTVADWQRAAEKSQRAPETLSSDDLTILQGFGGERAMRDAIARRDAVLRPSAPPVASSSAPVVTRAEAPVVEFPDQLWEDNAPDPVQAMAAWADENAMRAVPIALWWGAVSSARKNRQALEQKVVALEAEVETLKAALATLDAKALRGGGTWQRGQDYAVGDCVQHDGSLWRCVETHLAGASFSHECFLLQVKRGRDAR